MCKKNTRHRCKKCKVNLHDIISFHDIISYQIYSEAVARRCSVKKVLLGILLYSVKNTCTRVSLLIKLQQAETWHFIKKKTLAQVLSCEFCKTFKNAVFTEHLRATAYFMDISMDIDKGRLSLSQGRIVLNVFGLIPQCKGSKIYEQGRLIIC